MINKKNKSNNINKIFDYILILYKNNKYNLLSEVLNTSKRTGINGYRLDISNNELRIEINMKKLDDNFDLTEPPKEKTPKIPNKITLIFDRLIRDPTTNTEQYIYTNIKYTDFIHISNLFTILPNIPFLKLNSFSETQNKIYNIFFNKISVIIKYIINIKNNTENKNVGNIEDIINAMNDIINYYFIYFSNNDLKKTYNTQLKLYLNSLLNSNISVTFYIIDLILDISHKIQNKYNEFSKNINELLKNDTRFIDCIYRPGSFVDILYNMINYFSDPLNSEDPSFLNKSYGFYYKTENGNYINYVINENNNVNKEFILSFTDIIKNYNKIEKILPERNIRKKELNEPYLELFKKLNNEINNILKTVLNIKYANIKINKKQNRGQNITQTQQKIIKDLTDDKYSKFIDYNNIDFNRNDSLRRYNKGDVILFKFIRNTKTNNLFNTINLFIPYKNIDNIWKPFNELIDINYTNKNLQILVNKNLNIYGISNYNEIFKSDLIDNYIITKNLLLKEILPFRNDYSSVEKENICYIKLENKELYLYLNKYKFHVNIRKLINSNLYLIYRTIYNINYYLEYVKIDDIYTYKWIREESNLIDKLVNKLLFIDNTGINETDTTEKIVIKNEQMVEIEYLNRFSLMFSHINRFINNGDGDCNLLDTYFTIHNKNYRKIINNNNILEILDITLNNAENTFILKDKYGEINDKIGNYKYYFTNEECNSYIIYSPSHNSDDMLILNKNFEFEKKANNSISINDLLNNSNINSNYIINLKYSLEKNIFYELDENCIKRDNGKQLKIQDISEIEQLADKNRYFIYIIDKNDGLDKGIIDEYYNKENENVPDKLKACYIIPIKPINKLKILEKKSDGKFEDTNLLLKTISPNSDYFVIENKKNEYLQAKTIIQYKKPLRINLEFVKTNIVNSNYLFTIKNNIENVENVNILNTNKQCLIGGQKIISTNSIKKQYLTEINEKFNNKSNYIDLCHDNTNISFINYNTIETQDDVSYFECREKCNTNETCSGFSMSSFNGRNICKTYEKKDDTSILFYDCNKKLTENNDIGEIKKEIKIPVKNEEGVNEIKNQIVEYYKIDLINNSLYYIECKKTNNEKNLYINLDKKNSTFTNKNHLNCIEINNLNKETIYSNNIFRLEINKTNNINGNIKFYSILANDNFILGSYNNGLTNIEITYDSQKNKFIWDGGIGNKWYLESTNDIFEYIVLEGTGPDDEFYCPHYKNGYKSMEVYRNNTEISVKGPDGNYIRLIPDENISIFKNIKNKNDLGIVDINYNNYDGNIFLVNNKKHKNYYNLFTIFENQKFYLYLDSDNFVKFIKNNENIDNDTYLWKFNLFSNEKNKARSFQILKGGKLINQDIFTRKLPNNSNNNITKKTNKNNELKGGVKLNNLINGNSYYIKSKNDEYICANKNYKNKNGTINKIIAISIDSKLATNPNNIIDYNNKFIRASIDLSDTPYNIFKKYKIDDDIMWKLIIEEGDKKGEKTYKFYNIKHNLYLTFSSEIDSFIINKTGSSIFYNIVKKDVNSNLNIIINNQIKNIDKIYELQLSEITERNEWSFINPNNYKNTSPYIPQTIFQNLENGKIYRIINEGVKNNDETNTYLTINGLNNELLIPYNENTFTNKLEDDPTLWRCIINEDKTYSFELVKTGQKLGDGSGNLFKNIGNKLNFKNIDYTIDKKYLTDKFYIQHNTNEYYNIINSKNLNYKMTGFSNDINTYDNYESKNIKYIHKIANNSEWIITSKVFNEYTKSDIFSNELYPSKTNKYHYSCAYNYNNIYNTIYNEKNILTTDKNILVKSIETNLNSFKNKNGFTLSANIKCKTISSRKLGENYVSIILNTDTHFYIIRLVNYSKKSTLIRITENEYKNRKNEDQRIQFRKSTLENFKKLDFIIKTRGSTTKNEIKMKICAPDIYTNNENSNIFYLDEAKFNLTYDNEFVNIYINNKLITFFRKKDLLINQIFYTSSNKCTWTNTKWWSHNKLLNIPIWKTQNIDNYIENRPGIRFTSKINKNVKLECYVKKHSDNFFYIINNKNEYLSIVGTTENQLNYETKWTTDNSTDNCLWKLYDTNINMSKDINIIEGTPANNDLLQHSFKCLKKSINTVANIESENYLDNIENSTNIMVRAKINNTTKLIDEISNYTYSIIDINPDEENLNYKKCYWTHNQNGHTSIDYGSYDLGSHFTTDLWNIQYILGVTPNMGDKFLVKYKSNKGIIRIDRIVNLDYPEYGMISTTAQARWLNWDKIKEFPLIKSQNNVYIENKINQDIEEGNICISKNTDSSSPSLFSASCSNVLSREQCNDPPDNMDGMDNSVERLFLENKTCDEYMYKNYALVKASVEENNILTGGNNKQKGGNIWITHDSLRPIPPADKPKPNEKRGQWYFYLNYLDNNRNIFTTQHNVI